MALPHDNSRGVSFDRIADTYDETRGSDWRVSTTATALARWLLRDAPVVEVGVGTGLIAGRLRTDGWPVVGFDLSPRMLREATRRLGAAVGVGDAQQLPVRDASVGSVYFVHVLHLVADVTATLREAVRVLRPGGRLLAVCAPDDGPRNETAQLMARLRERLSGPREDTPERVVATAEAAGCTLIGRETLTGSSLISPEAIAARLEQRIWSWTWDVPEDVWAAEAEPVIARLRAMPDPDEPRQRSRERSLLVLSAPGRPVART